MKKRCLLNLWNTMLLARDIHCEYYTVGCDNCGLKRLCADLDATYKWLEKKYGED